MSAFRGRFLCMLVLCLCCSVEMLWASTGAKAIFSTNLGGSGFDEGFAVATDADGNVYAAGLTNSPSFPGTSAAPSGASDLFVTKFSPTGEILYTRLIGGSTFDDAYGIAVDIAGNIYVTGDTGSSDFPIVNGFQTIYGGGFSDAFILKLDPAGDIVYSSYLGGLGGNDAGNAIVVDNNGNAYIAGRTDSADFPTHNAAQGTYGGSFADAFVAKVNTTIIGSSSLVYSTYLGGPLFDSGNAIAIDSSGNAYVTGGTGGCCIPTTPDAFQAFSGGSLHVFVTKFGPSGDLRYSTLLGGTGHDLGRGIATDGLGKVFVTGETSSLDFPTTAGAFQSSNNMSANSGTAFVFEMNTSAGRNGLIYSTYLGGQGPDSGSGIAVDSSGHIFVTGYTRSPNFPVQNAINTNLPGFQDAFVVELDPKNVGAAGLLFGTFLGQSLDNEALGIALASDQRWAVTGFTDQIPNGSTRDAFVDYFSFDITPPALTVPADTTLNATGPAGVSFNFSASAIDSADPHPLVGCQPVSGTVFPIGTTLDTCTGTDATGNTATASFHVAVEGGAQQTSDLEHYVVNLTLANGLTNSLNSKLQSAQQDPLAGACTDLSSFMSQVNAQTDKGISFQQASFMNSSATRIQLVIGCH
jgi:hypothetical protein